MNASRCIDPRWTLSISTSLADKQASPRKRSLENLHEAIQRRLDIQTRVHRTTAKDLPEFFKKWNVGFDIKETPRCQRRGCRCRCEGWETMRAMNAGAVEFRIIRRLTKPMRFLEVSARRLARVLEEVTGVYCTIGKMTGLLLLFCSLLGWICIRILQLLGLWYC